MTTELRDRQRATVASWQRSFRSAAEAPVVRQTTPSRSLRGPEQRRSATSSEHTAGGVRVQAMGRNFLKVRDEDRVRRKRLRGGSGSGHEARRQSGHRCSTFAVRGQPTHHADRALSPVPALETSLAQGSSDRLTGSRGVDRLSSAPPRPRIRVALPARRVTRSACVRGADTGSCVGRTRLRSPFGRLRPKRRRSSQPDGSRSASGFQNHHELSSSPAAVRPRARRARV